MIQKMENRDIAKNVRYAKEGREEKGNKRKKVKYEKEGREEEAMMAIR